MPYTPENNPYIPGDPYSYDLKWIVDHIKQALALYQPLHDEFEQIQEEFGQTQSDFTDLYNYVHDYFDTLDVSDELEAILNEWVDNGSFAALIHDIYDSEYNNYLLALGAFVTPKMFGAAGDGTTVDNAALNSCFQYCATHNVPCYGENLTYVIDNSTASLTNHYGVIVPGGITIRNCHFKLASGCPDMTTLLACQYNSNPYIIEDCIFEGELRTITSGSEDGGNHGIIFCNTVTMFPSDWQDYADITISRCRFVNIQSYGIFPSPIINKLTVKDCDISAHGCGILAYSLNTVISNCKYTYLAGSNTTVHTLAIDEIENFTAPANNKKNITIKNSYSSVRLYTINHGTQPGLIYGNINIYGCESNAELMVTTISGGNFITCDKVHIKNCKANGTVGDYGYAPAYIIGDVEIDSVITGKKNRIGVTNGNCNLKNLNVAYQIFLSTSTFIKMNIENCRFTGSNSDGLLSSAGAGGYATADEINFINCQVDTASFILRNMNATTINVVGLYAATEVRLLYCPTAQATNIYCMGVIIPTSNPANHYFVDGITGALVVRGIGGTLRLHSVALSTLDMTAIPT